jgi:succinate dehydrogenase/fumarate reductase flavoprotein subunit
VNESLPHAAAWVPVSKVPRRDGTWGVFTHFVDRSKPGVIAVTRNGTRFVNEANSYHDFIQAMLRACKHDTEKYAFFICDHRTIRRYGLGYTKPAPVPLGGYIRSGYLIKGRTLRELASKAGIDPVTFEETIRRYNESAVEGRDPEFGRGTNAYNISLGDPDHLPNPCVAPVATPPFYAVKVVTGDLGTFAGLKTDARARVLNDAGEAVPGLFAVGNDAASIMGGNYPGGGITLGPAMTFGFIAGRELVRTSDSRNDDGTMPQASELAE